MGSRVSLQPDKEGGAENKEDISRSKVPSHSSGLRMNTASPTILRTRHKFGDYLSQPDLAKFELPKKMSRPWIVNNAFEQEKLKDLIVTERPVEASLVMRQIKESKQERKKQAGYNKKHVRNINDIIEKDQNTVKESKKKQSTGILWHTLAYSGILWHNLAYSGILWHNLAYSGILWHTLAYSGILCHTLAYSGILWHTLAYSCIFWHTLAFSCIL